MDQNSIRFNKAFCKAVSDFGISCRYETDDGDAFSDLVNLIDRIIQENRKDAERYRWLREGKPYNVNVPLSNGKSVTYLVSPRPEDSYAKALDGAIDENISKNDVEVDKPLVPSGYVLVPLEPTEEQIQAGCLNQQAGPDKFTNYKDWWNSHSGGISEKIRRYVASDYRVMVKLYDK